MNLIDLFQSFRNSRLSYCVLSGWKQLPHAFQQEIFILTPSKKQLLSAGNFVHTDGPHYDFPLRESGPDVVAKFFIGEKSHGLFPDRFETELLTHCTDYAETIRVPESHYLGLAHLYWHIFHANGFADQPERRQCLIDFVQDKVGPCVPCAIEGVATHRV